MKCPHCNCSFTTKKQAKATQEVIERDGVTYYGKFTNFTTGARKTFTSFPIKEKKQKPKTNYATHDTWATMRGYHEGLRALHLAYGEPKPASTGFVMVQPNVNEISATA